MKWTKLVLAATLCSLSGGAKAAGADVATAAMLHQEYTDVVIASEQCAGVKLDIKKWDQELRKAAGSSGPGMVKAFDVSEQGGAWREKRYDEFKAEPAKECAAAMETYGPKGLLIKK
ncbi:MULTISPECIES: hypothetical protein [Bradyrhizobium]|uniref:hypothetical protein n=1 Tax=Bradyrhizobium elkanii TaxID=29448 RepID=UPI0004040548|nr:hypothetical protein [Bradyrhizobium elkanii]